jgi:hypothetical protein
VAGSLRDERFANAVMINPEAVTMLLRTRARVPGSMEGMVDDGPA